VEINPEFGSEIEADPVRRGAWVFVTARSPTSSNTTHD
jgi:hypothetical protein